ncbi:protein HOTHEAD isoform X2 [Cryptomeria japonica]|uniref:protein HOTHEAD isoform X2 n=1 Tax=Cryptomeria japonica TaxID=3369 RepID=UPI0027DA3BAE|nr:protein HOTHEAD isoform X2 [Cryptomeria japonica]
MGVKANTVFICFVLHTFLCIPAEGRKQLFMKEAKKNAHWKKSDYDYIIVGGGTAGCPLAATLSQNMSVLLLERGGSPFGNSNITDIHNFYANLLDYESPHTPTQEFISEDGVINARARVLGGGTCLNAGFYTRASSSEVRSMGLEPSLVEQSYQWVESTIAHRPAPNKWQNAVAEALTEAGVSPYNGFTYDHIPGTKLGGTIFNSTGHRSTAADILVKHANPRKLTVLLYATVQRLLLSTKGKSRPKAYGVVFRDRDGAEHRVLLKKGNSEVIISAGALGSPQLLMLSGIGPAEELKNMGIRVIMDQPEVGKNMADNPMNPIFVPSAVPLELSLIQVVGITKFGSFIEASSGYGLSSENIMNKGGIILEKVSGPHSRGYLRLNSTNAGDNPVVKFNYFEHPVDLQRCVKGIRTIEKIIISRPMKQFIPPNVNLTQIMSATFQHPINLIPRKTGDWDSLKQFCKDRVTTIWHYHGGCQVGSVVDGEYKLIGADGVRVIDGSTFLFSPGTNPQATVLMLGRYMGVRILREQLGRSTEV